MNERQLAAVEAVTERHRGEIGTHYETCWMYHAGCLAALLADLED